MADAGYRAGHRIVVDSVYDRDIGDHGRLSQRGVRADQAPRPKTPRSLDSRPSRGSHNGDDNEQRRSPTFSRLRKSARSWRPQRQR